MTVHQPTICKVVMLDRWDNMTFQILSETMGFFLLHSEIKMKGYGFMSVRTIRNISEMDGRTYVYLANDEIGNKFMHVGVGLTAPVVFLQQVLRVIADIDAIGTKGVDILAVAQGAAHSHAYFVCVGKLGFAQIDFHYAEVGGEEGLLSSNGDIVDCLVCVGRVLIFWQVDDAVVDI